MHVYAVAERSLKSDQRIYVVGMYQLPEGGVLPQAPHVTAPPVLHAQPTRTVTMRAAAADVAAAQEVVARERDKESAALQRLVLVAERLEATGDTGMLERLAQEAERRLSGGFASILCDKCSELKRFNQFGQQGPSPGTKERRKRRCKAMFRLSWLGSVMPNPPTACVFTHTGHRATRPGCLLSPRPPSKRARLPPSSTPKPRVRRRWPSRCSRRCRRQLGEPNRWGARLSPWCRGPTSPHRQCPSAPNKQLS